MPKNSSERLSRQERLRKPSEFRRAQRGKRVDLGHFIILCLQTSDARPARLGLVVSRKVGNAVVRNRVKRLVREAFRRYKRSVPAGIDLVIIAKPRVGQVVYTQVAEELAKFCQTLFTTASPSP